MTELHPLQYEEIVKQELRMDMGIGGDLTTLVFVPESKTATAELKARKEGVLAGLEPALFSFTAIDPAVTIERLARDGDRLEPGMTIARISGKARSLLSGERTCLNILSHLSGIASQTALMVKAVAGTRAKITETRKTLPGLRILQKYAVRCGGGVNHRYTLDGAVMLKDNHLAAYPSWEAGIAELRKQIGHTVKIEMEVDSIDQLKRILGLGIDIVLLDNFTVPQLAEAVKLIDGSMIAEASGNITAEGLAAIAATGVDIISSGALTHSVKALDIGLDFLD